MDVRRDMTAKSPEAPTVSASRARQGVSGHNVRYVLGFGLTGVIILFAIIYLYYFGR